METAQVNWTSDISRSKATHFKMRCSQCGQLFEAHSVYSRPPHPGMSVWCSDRCFRAHEYQEKRTDVLHQLIHDGLAPAQMLNETFAASDPKIEAVNAPEWLVGRDWGFKSNLYIHGVVEAGKTFLARCVARKFHDLGVSMVAIRAMEYFDMLNAANTYGKFGDEYKLRVNKINTCRLLLLDDIDKYTYSERDVSKLWALFDTRAHQATQKMIITSNLNPAGLKNFFANITQQNKSLADSLLARLKPCTIIELKGRN